MKTDFCVIGSGIAGMSMALRLAKIGNVTMISKGGLLSGSTPLAQGGIAAVTDVESDSFESHFNDTLKAGKYTNDTDAVQILVESAPRVMSDLKKWGIDFFPGKHLEGGHSNARIFHASDQTGKHIANGLSIKIDQNKNITFISDSVVHHLCAKSKTVVGYNFKTQQEFTLSAKAIIFATGGYSSLFASSTSPAGNIGSGIAVLKNAGAKLRNMSSVQFHPTVLNRERFPRLLLTEALRGAGAQIVNSFGKKIVNPLLPRDEVSKAIYLSEKKKEEVFLDTRMIENFAEKFSFLHATLVQDFQLDPCKDMLPITYGAHYCMGGVKTDLYGRTNLQDIYAIGECAFTGVHGDNRLASNSLLEGLVFAEQAFEDIQKNNPTYSKNEYSKKLKFISSLSSDPLFRTIQKTLSQSAGIERNSTEIHAALKFLQSQKPKATRETMILQIAIEILRDALAKLTEEKEHL